ncbi:MAG: cytochrome c [Caldilineaceae bacterium]|nr:cytochrome c [Caldilineaceae bacterium]
MPHFTEMADDDVMDLIAYLRSQEPVENAVPDRELTVEVHHMIEDTSPAEAPTEGVERGAYIVALARCTQCHTPSNDDGSKNMDLFLAGAPFRDTVAPNLTPDEGTGLGAWSEQEIADFLATGVYDDGTESHGGMKGVVDSGIGMLTDDDRLAVAAYLKSLDPIDNLPEPSE